MFWLNELEKGLNNKLLKVKERLKDKVPDLTVTFEPDLHHKFPVLSVTLYEIRDNYCSNQKLEVTIENTDDKIVTYQRPICYDLHYMFNIFSMYSDEYRMILNEFYREFGQGFVIKLTNRFGKIEDFQFFVRKMYGEYQFNNDYDENGNIILRKILLYYVSTVPLDDSDDILVETEKVKEFQITGTMF